MSDNPKAPSTDSNSTDKGNSLPLFRSQALEALETPEQLDQLIQVVPPRGWIALLAFYLILISLLLWGIFGSIPTRVEGKGVLLSENGYVYNAVAPPGGGRVLEIVIKDDQQVKKGEVLALLERPDLIEKLMLSKNYVEQLKKEYEDLQKTAAREIETRVEDLKRQRLSLETSLDNEKTHLQQIEALLAIKEDSFKKGLVGWQDIEGTRRDLFATKDRTEQLKVQLNQIQTQEADFKDQWRQRLKDKELALLGEELKVNNMKAEIEVSQTVTSPASGYIISVNTSVGKMLGDGGSVATIASLGEGLDALIFMLPREGQRVAAGMKSLVTPVTIEKEEYGSMRGTVIDVSEFPETGETIKALFHSEELTKQFVEEGAPVGIRIRIERDPNTFSGYTWSSSKGPEKKIIPGTLAEARITVREQPPITLIIPAFKKLFRIAP